MSKQTRKEKREEERRILAEMEEAVVKERATKSEKKEGGMVELNEAKSENVSTEQPAQIHCRRCKSLMENGVCPVCGYKTYIPMSEERRKKTRGIVTVVALGIFVILFFVLQIGE